MIGMEPEAIKEESNDVGGLGASRASIEMKFVDNEMKDVLLIGIEPDLRLVEDHFVSKILARQRPPFLTVT
ncbi:hypothetical protein MK280_11185, partial [Myxococcota bacterium]|nr:hypothetical protein [Myxococcota bacterium]